MNAVKIAIMGTVSIAIQSGLAIAGWDGWDAFFQHNAFRAPLVVTAVLLVISVFSGGGISPGEKEDRGTRWVLAAFTGIALGMSYFSAYSDRMGFWTLDGDAIRWVGVVVCFLGGLLRIIPVFALGNRCSGLVALQPGHKLETRGIYSVIRNPSYLGMVITALGWVLMFRSVIGILGVATMLVPLVARIHAEERLLREQIGAEYEDYFKRTWRLLPGIRGRRHSESQSRRFSFPILVVSH